MKYLIALLSIILISYSCDENSETKDSYGRVSAQVFKQQIENQGAILLDVRTPEEYNQGHISGSINIDFTNENFIQNFQSKFNTNDEILLYCQSGGRSGRALKEVNKLGYNKVYELQGGYSHWDSSLAN